MVSVLAAGVDPAAMHMHPHLDPAISSSSWPAYVHRLDDPALDCEEDELCKFPPERVMLSYYVSLHSRLPPRTHTAPTEKPRQISWAPGALLGPWGP